MGKLRVVGETCFESNDHVTVDLSQADHISNVLVTWISEGITNITLSLQCEIGSTKTVDVTLNECRNLKIDFETSWNHLNFLEFTNISDRQWEHIHWLIRDFANESFYVICRSIDVRVIGDR